MLLDSPPGFPDSTSPQFHPGFDTLPPLPVPAQYFCATTPEQVKSAWQLVYRRYQQLGLISFNQAGVHFPAVPFGQHLCVVGGTTPIANSSSPSSQISATLTLIKDNPAGLPLDSVYGSYLAILRQAKRNLVEIGLLAVDSQAHSNHLRVLFDLMCWGVHFALYHQAHDILIGVHPHHASFYCRCYGFTEFAPETSYPAVNHRSVVLLRLSLPEKLAQAKLPRGLKNAMVNPVPLSEFSASFPFKLLNPAVSG